MANKKSKSTIGISYGRVSTLGQALNADGSRKDDGSPEAQKNRCLEHIKYLSKTSGVKYELKEHISDEGLSGKDTNRPGYQKMWSYVASGAISFVVSTELSRLSRSVFDFLKFIQHCEKHDVAVHIIGIQVDTSTPFGRMLVVILVALAQFEREMTAQRVRENVLSRLLSDGKINGSAEILGLIRDPNRKGHFIKDEAAIPTLEKLLKLILKFSSKKKILAMAKETGLTGLNGKEVTAHILDTVIENVKWRYRGLWYVNKENKNIDDQSLPDYKQYREIHLPHGAIVDIKLLDAVQAKVADTYTKKKKTGVNDYTYILSHVLYYEDGSNFSGQVAKNREYRYYHNRANNIRVRCDEIDPIIVDRAKAYFLNEDTFQIMVKNAVKRQEIELPKIEAEISKLQKEYRDLEKKEGDLSEKLISGDTSKKNFMNFLEEQIEVISSRKGMIEQEIDHCEEYRTQIMSRSGLDDLKAMSKDMVNRFDKLTGTEQRNLLEKIFKRIVVRKDNKLDLEVQGFDCPISISSLTLGGSGGSGNAKNTVSKGSVASGNKSTECKRNGVDDGARTHDAQNHNLVLYQLNYIHHTNKIAHKLHYIKLLKTWSVLAYPILAY